MSPSGDPGSWEALCDEAASPRWARDALARLGEAGVPVDGLGAAARRRLVAALGSSRAAASWIAADASLVAVFEDLGFDEPLDLHRYGVRLGRPDRGESLSAFRRRLRRGRQRELLRLQAREALGSAPVEVSAAEVAALAEAAVEIALERAQDDLSLRWGAPEADDGAPNPPCVLGMGKLGGGELNLCSDIDLVFLFRTGQGRTAGGAQAPVDVRTFFGALAAAVADALGRVTEDGLVFRVDLGLRPEGRSGELAHSLDGAVSYYQHWGQTWERAALLKARPVAGDRALGRQFLAEVEPFVFRRSLDFTAVEDFKALKSRIDAGAAQRPGGSEDLKVGRGGIREVEFVVQTLQLIHGGRRPEVRERGTLPALAALCRAGVLEPAAADGLARGYRFLRTLEHAVQALRFVRTHRLPRDPDELSLLGRRMGLGAEADPAAGLLAALAGVRAEVRGAFDGLFRGAGAPAGETPGDREARSLLSLTRDDADAAERLCLAGFRDPGRALEALRVLREGPFAARSSPRARRTLERMAPRLLAEVASSADPDQALQRLGDFLVASKARASYLALLEENPSTARLLIALFGASGYLSRYLIAHPELLDELVSADAAGPYRVAADLDEELEETLHRCADDEEWLDALRRFRNAEFLRVALGDLWGALTAEEVGRRLTRVAEVCLDAACRHARRSLARRLGEPLSADGTPARFAILGLGKLGGAETDYHSDLDLLFLYSSRGCAPARGGGPVAAPEFFARLAQRVMSLLSARTREGIAFRTDARLRPSGRAGPLVTSLEAFAAYHGKGSQTWERQALVKLRPVAGDRGLGEEALEVAQRLLYAGPPARDPRPDIARMRERIELEAEQRGGGVRVDLKAGAGGIVDVEFAAQALQMLHGWRTAALRSANTLEALSALTRAGALADERAEALSDGYVFLRRLEAKLRILQDRPTDVLPTDPRGLAKLARSMGVQGAGGAERLLSDVRRHRRRIREAFDDVFQRGVQ